MEDFIFFSEAARICVSICKKAVMISHYDLHRKLKGVLNDVCQCRCMAVFFFFFFSAAREEARGSILVTGL